jgi:hypothetical protein
MMVAVKSMRVVRANVPVNDGILMIGIRGVPMLLSDGRRYDMPRQEGNGSERAQQADPHRVTIRVAGRSVNSC